MELNGSLVEDVDEFKYLGSSEVTGEASCTIPQAFKAFGSLHDSCIRFDFGDNRLCIDQ